VSDPVGITTGMAETSLGPPPPGAADSLARALGQDAAHRRSAVADVVRAHPQWPDGWAALGDQATDDLDAYACFRVGYHRGLDALRKAGWRGSGYVRWSVADNRGFLRCVDGLGRAARAIGEESEARRCEQFLRQLDPAWTSAGPPS
jgi:Protein of unknown function (DUF3151)